MTTTNNNKEKQIEMPPSNPNFVEIEHQMLQFWKDNKTFQKQLDQHKDKQKFIFLEGPAFCQSTMHYGHILTWCIKDSICRYFSTNGYNVPRKLGFDTHGLPIEYEADKQLGISSSSQIVSQEKLEQLKKMNVPGTDKMITIDYYNEFCENLVLSTAEKWNAAIERLARWIDIENGYKTMHPTFMETSWWVFKQLWDKKLVYQGVKVMPFSWKLGCSLSNFEAGQNYKEVIDPCVVIKFKAVEQPVNNVTRYFLAWTTTPWTLPSNLALCVNEEMTYCIVSQKDKPEEQYILAEERLPFVFLTGKEKKLSNVINILEKFPGKELKGKQYYPLFPYFQEYKERYPQAFTVLSDSYVTNDSGTGVVHQAPYFGEDDYRVCMAAGVISQKEQKIVCPVDDNGCFTEEVKEFKGLYVKDADKQIIKLLKEQNKLISQSTIKHSYPYCYRSDTPLIYKAVPSWFINVTAIKDKMLQNHMTTHWVPDSFLTGRMKNWVENARDWAVSRNRFWGCPIPVWESQDGQIRICVGSLDKLKQLAGEEQLEKSGIFSKAGDNPHNIHFANIHRQFVDRITIPDPRGQEYPPLHRIEPVFDCWFESGSMPYGQIHYPWCDLQEGDSKEKVHFKFQQEPGTSIADFIAEGQDQVRGWFYTLLVESTALFDVPPSMNTIVNGLILAKDGQKMSKKLRNYPDPNEVIEQYGADAVRLYLINSPSVRAMEMKFNVDGVKAVTKDVFIPLYNVYRLLIQSILRQNKQYQNETIFTANIDKLPQLQHIFDIYIINSFIQLTNQIHTEMKSYKLYTVLPKLLNFLSDLTNYYVRFNRDRMKAGETANQVVYFLIINFCTLLAPFCPFISEHIYRSLIKVSNEEMPESVHLQRMASFTEEQQQKYNDQDVMTKIDNLKQIIVLGRQCRLTQCKISSFKTPLNGVKILCEKQSTLDGLKQLEQYISQELNVLNISYSTDINNYCQLKLYALIDKIKSTLTNKQLIGKTVKEAMALSKNYTQEQVAKLQAGESLECNGVKLENEFFQITLEPTKPKSLAQGIFCVEFDTTSTNDVVQQLVQREVFSKINKLRKSYNLQMNDKKNVIISQVNNQEVVSVQKVIEDIKNKVNGEIKLQDTTDDGDFDVEVEGLKLRIELEN